MGNKRIEVLQKLLSEIEANIPNKDVKNDLISQATVGWQIDHALKVINGVCGILIKTNPEKYKKEFNLKRMILFPLCYIPRGKARAPKQVLPPDIILKEDLLKQLEASRANIKTVSSLPGKSHFIHHIFGMLSKKQTLRFLEMHTKHHMKIIRDIQKQ